MAKVAKIANQGGLKPADKAKLIPANIKAGVTIAGVTGNSNVVDTSLGNAAAGQILSGYRAYVDGARVDGTIQNRGGAVTVTPSTANQIKSSGYYSGNITVAGDPDLVSANIKAGKNIFGVSGAANVIDTTADGSTASNPQVLAGYNYFRNGQKLVGTMPNRGGAQTITPSTTDQVLSSGYYSGNITVEGDPALDPANFKEGVTIFGQTGTVKEDMVGNIDTGNVVTTHHNKNMYHNTDGTFTEDFAIIPSGSVMINFEDNSWEDDKENYSLSRPDTETSLSINTGSTSRAHHVNVSIRFQFNDGGEHTLISESRTHSSYSEYSYIFSFNIIQCGSDIIIRKMYRSNSSAVGESISVIQNKDLTKGGKIYGRVYRTSNGHSGTSYGEVAFSGQLDVYNKL